MTELLDTQLFKDRVKQIFKSPKNLPDFKIAPNYTSGFKIDTSNNFDVKKIDKNNAIFSIPFDKLKITVSNANGNGKIESYVPSRFVKLENNIISQNIKRGDLPIFFTTTDNLDEDITARITKFFFN